MTSLLFVASIALSVVASPLSTSFEGTQRLPFGVAPLLAAEHPHGSVNNSYIIMLKPEAGQHLNNHLNFLERTHALNPLLGSSSGLKHVYEGPFVGYAGYFAESTVDQIRQMPEVDFVERDQIVRTTEVQRGAPWVCSVFPIHPIPFYSSILPSRVVVFFSPSA